MGELEWWAAIPGPPQRALMSSEVTWLHIALPSPVSGARRQWMEVECEVESTAVITSQDCWGARDVLICGKEPATR
jgi:hypothetical protein